MPPTSRCAGDPPLPARTAAHYFPPLPSRPLCPPSLCLAVVAAAKPGGQEEPDAGPACPELATLMPHVYACAHATPPTPRVQFVKGDIQSMDLVKYVLETEKIDTVMHFAAQVRTAARSPPRGGGRGGGGAAQRRPGVGGCDKLLVAVV